MIQYYTIQYYCTLTTLLKVTLRCPQTLKTPKEISRDTLSIFNIGYSDCKMQYPYRSLSIIVGEIYSMMIIDDGRTSFFARRRGERERKRRHGRRNGTLKRDRQHQFHLARLIGESSQSGRPPFHSRRRRRRRRGRSREITYTCVHAFLCMCSDRRTRPKKSTRVDQLFIYLSWMYLI